MRYEVGCCWGVMIGAMLLGGCGGSTTQAVGADGGSHDAAGDSTVRPDAGGDATSLGDGPSGFDSGAPDVSYTPLPEGGVNLAVHQLFVGDSDRMFNESKNAWMAFGLNIDGKVTTAGSNDVCTLQPGAANSVQVDGNNGIDNSWGANIVPLLQSAMGMNLSQNYSSQINSGAFTFMLDLSGLTSDPMQTAATLPAQLFAGVKFPGMPTWTVADDWPVRPDLLVDPTDITKGSKVQFTTGSIMAGTWSSGSPVDLPLALVINGAELDVVLHHAVLQLDHSAPTKGTNGTVSGVLNTDEFVTTFQGSAGRFSPLLCAGIVLQSILDQLRQASDIMTDGTNAPGVMCDGISVGLGFNADQIGLPQTVGAEPDAGPNPCDASVD